MPRGVEGMVRHPLRAAFGVVGDHRRVPAKCGDDLPEERSGPLSLTGSFPARVRAFERTTFDGTVTVVNRSDRRVEGLAASRPDVYLLQSGRIVATPLPRDEVGLQVDLAPGAGRDLTATGSLTSCSAARPLAPGRYEIHAVLPIVGTDGTMSAPAVGGPWSLQVL
jgi:hypothetical protein